MAVRRVIHRRDPFVASRAADARGRREAQSAPERTRFFVEREVLNPDGSFPFGEGYLYEPEPSAREASFKQGKGRPASISSAGHAGTKAEQQDAWGSRALTVAGQSVVIAAVADGVSASGPLARPAADLAVNTFLEQVAARLEALPAGKAQGRPFVDEAMKAAALRANFEMLREVTFDRAGAAGFDEADATWLKAHGQSALPTGAVTTAEIEALAPAVDRMVSYLSGLPGGPHTGLATFAATVIVGSDLTTFSTGDAVVALFRPTEPAGDRVVHLTHRDQEVVRLYCAGGEGWRNSADVHENVITDALGDRGTLTGTLRRFPALLASGDRVVLASDGLSPHGPSRGVTRAMLEQVLVGGGDAQALVEAQLTGLAPDSYQDNIGVVVVTIE